MTSQLVRTTTIVLGRAVDYIWQSKDFLAGLNYGFLKIKFGVAGFLLDIRMKYAIFFNCRYVLDQEKIRGFSKPVVQLAKITGRGFSGFCEDKF